MTLETKSNWLTFAGFLVLLMGALFLATNITRINSIWTTFVHRTVSRQDLLNQIRGEFGYGGLIHNFKNYVLRGDSDNAKHIVEGFRRSHILVQEAIYRYEQLDISKAERDSLKTIKAIADEYATKMQLARIMVVEGRGPREIDARIRVDDGSSLRAFATIEDVLSLSTSEHSLQMGDQVYGLLLVFAVVFLVVGGFGLLNAQIMRSIALTLKDVSASIVRLAHGDYRAHDKTYSHIGSDELGLLQQAYNKLQHGLDRLQDRVAQVASGDLRSTLLPFTDQGIDDIAVKGPLADSFAKMVESLDTAQLLLKEEQAKVLHSEKLSSIGQLAAGMAHDLGNPLSGIDMHLQLLADEELPPDARESLGTVRHEVSRLRRVLRDLVDFVRRRRTEEHLTSLNSVVEDAIRLLRYDQRMKKVDVNLRSDPETPPILAVEDHLMQVCLNLFINALDAIPLNGTIDIDLAPGPDNVTLSIKDNGTGMSSATFDRCFEPLFSTKPADKGTGLGLTMCRDIIHRAGGEITIASAVGVGTTVRVEFPIAAVSPESNEASL